MSSFHMLMDTTLLLLVFNFLIIHLTKIIDKQVRKMSIENLVVFFLFVV